MYHPCLLQLISHYNHIATEIKLRLIDRYMISGANHLGRILFWISARIQFITRIENQSAEKHSNQFFPDSVTPLYGVRLEICFVMQHMQLLLWMDADG